MRAGRPRGPPDRSRRGRRTETHAGERGQFSARRKADHADAGRVHAPFAGAASHQTQRALQVREGVGLDLISRSVLAREAVLQDEAGNAVVREPGGDVVAFVIHPEFAVSAARADHHPGPGVFPRRRKHDCDRWVMDSREDVFALIQAHFLGSGFSFGARRVALPERDHGRIAGSAERHASQADGHERREQEQMFRHGNRAPRRRRMIKPIRSARGPQAGRVACPPISYRGLWPQPKVARVS